MNADAKHNTTTPAASLHARTAEQEFERLYLQSYSMVYGYVRVRMASDAEAEDVVAEAYLKAARAFATFDPARSKFGTWVVAIAKNCMISYFRKQRPNAALDDVPESLVAVPAEQAHVDDILLVKQLLACLADDERELIALKYRDGMRNVDIAAELGMNASTVSTKVSSALAKMRAAMERSNEHGRPR